MTDTDAPVLPRSTTERVTIADVARAAGVSITVVSQALAGNGRVAPATRERVVRLARAMGYHPSARARSLKLGRAGTARCAVVSFGRDEENLSRVPYFGAVLSGIAARAAHEAMDVHLEVVSGAPEAEGAAGALERLVAADRADGCILLSAQHLDPGDVAPLSQSGIPFVLVNRHFGSTPVNCVVSDKIQANRALVRRLVGLGHRRMALLLPNQETSNVSDHRQGWQRGVRECGLDERDAPILRYASGPAAVERELVSQLLAEGVPNGRGMPTAVVTFDDEVANAVLHAASRAGLRVPERLSVIGYTNIIAPFTTPALCSHELHPFEAGAAAASLLAGLLRGEVAEPRRIVFMPAFVCRESCGPAPADA